MPGVGDHLYPYAIDVCMHIIGWQLRLEMYVERKGPSALLSMLEAYMWSPNLEIAWCH